MHQQVHTSRQVTLTDLREEFVLDYMKLCTLADIPLHNMETVHAEVL